MYIYAIIKKLSKNGEVLEPECFEEEEWEKTKLRIKKEQIVFSSPDVEELRQYNFDEIIWGRVFDPVGKSFRKIWVKLTYNVAEMEQLFEAELANLLETINQKLEEAKIKADIKYELYTKPIKENHNMAVEETSRLIPEDLDEHEALMKWKELNFIMPPPKKISTIKLSYNMSWKQFIEHVKEM